MPTLFLSDSEDDDAPPTPRHHTEPAQSQAHAKPQQEAEPARKRMEDAAANVPRHPIPAMQSAFAESLIEATTNAAAQKPKLSFGDAKTRHNHLIDAERGAELYAELWRYRPGQSYHELWKLMAQVSFGVYLLLNGIANSNIQVVNILQGHIDEVDEFLEVAMEDVNFAIEDVKERIDFLKLPMNNMSTFEKMLEDRKFRLQIVTGNERIEHIVDRTTMALEATLNDVEEGLKSTKEFAVYLGDQQNRPWRQQRPDVVDIFDAMKGNAEGWYKAFVDLQENASVLDSLLTKIGQMVAEMNLRAGEVSRRTRVSPSGFELNLRASALMPLQFTVEPFSGSATDATHPQQASSKASQRSSSSTSRRPSDPYFASHSPCTSTGSACFRSPPASPSARDTLPDFQYKPPQTSDTALWTVPILEIDTEPEPQRESLRPSPIEEEGLFILQPRTYTPLPPAPLPSPMVQDHPMDSRYEPRPEDKPAKRTSLRQRLSQRGNNPPQSIQVPPRNVNRGKYESPRESPRPPHGPDSAYGSDAEGRPPVYLDASMFVDLPPPAMPNTIPSPLSDKQFFRPVQASPHSPLQQRPWTAVTAPAHMHRPHTSATHHQYSHQRNAPSTMGMSMLSNVTTANTEHKKLKKKKSAFGWLKKAFSLDEEERAAFEAKRQQQSPNLYQDGRSPKFLDGRRVEEPKRYY
ncbi:uncharacterized protein BCR38DRAFT_357486 [Pseudomassariella vexata]|uniref:Uncharacterized protein n=1 Tax=Pseudomassariella vexata TaxID=1141098 RepID=A0A1Y2D687_9PEZI|nr:uncharacterized protein BCR38DRAFT_357486 [Pseudomassariella vexata]ORY54808.1 hypothetical protein BCR38DRAFT_357486 [Pseudomassariella vexata]